MGCFLNDVQEYSAAKMHELRIKEYEAYWRRCGYWLVPGAKKKTK